MKRILVIGDAITDVYHECTFNKMCPDDLSVKAIVKDKEVPDILPGGAANVAINVSALTESIIVDLISVVDKKLSTSIKALSNRKVCTDYCISGYPLRKERFLLNGYMILRVDNKLLTDEIMSNLVAESCREYFKNNNPDLIILSDYNGKTINSECLAILLEHRDKLLVDTKMKDLDIFGQGGKTLLVKLNHSEYSDVAANDSAPEKHFKAMIITRGHKDSLLIMHENIDNAKSITHRISCKTFRANTIDVCGCGDTFIAGLASSLLKNNDIFTAVQFANAAASTVVSQPRVAIANYSKTLELIGREKNEAI